MDVTGIKAFVPSKDYELSQRFYTEIGFESEYVSEELTLLRNGKSELFLQRFYDKALAENFMLQICVSDIEIAYERCAKSQYKTKVSAIQREAWGEVFYLWGPSGELLHVTQLRHSSC